MPERIKVESVAEEESVEFLPYFPTDLERAKDGAKKYFDAYEKSPVLRKAAENGKNKKIIMSAAGFYPEMGFYGESGFNRLKTSAERKELKRVYEEELGLKLLFWNEPIEDEEWQCSIINPASIEKVIRNCPIPNLFPEEAKRDPIKWVLNNKFEWDDPSSDGNFNDEEIRKRAIRFGILSGYSPYVSAVYPDFKLAEKAVINKLGSQEQEDYSKYVRSQRESRKLPKKFESPIASALENGEISNFQAKLLKNIYIRKDVEGFGYGFSYENEKYFDNIKIILDKLGIKDHK